MQTKHLIQFATVAEVGNISEAAKRLHIAQPALSQSILAFEEDLGVTLFVRHRRGVELTEVGCVLLEQARSILDQISSVRELVREADKSPSGNVTVAFPASVASAIVGPVCSRILEQYPLIRLQVDEGLTGNMTRWFRAGQIDIMIGFNVSEQAEYVSQPLIREQLYLIGRDLDSNQDITAKELEHYPLVLPSPEHAMGQTVARYELETGIELKRLPLRLAAHQALSLALSGPYYSISPWSLIHILVPQNLLKARKIVAPNATREAFLITSRIRPATSAAQAVKKTIIEVVTEAHQKETWRGELLI